MTRRRVARLLVAGCVLGALVNLLIAFGAVGGFRPGNLAATLVCVATAMWVWE